MMKSPEDDFEEGKTSDETPKEESSSTNPPPPPENPITVLETLGELDRELSHTRSDYAEQLIAWKNELRKKKNVFSKITSDLGFEKQMPQTAKPKGLIDAENAYIEAKKKKSKKILESATHKPASAPDSDGVINTEFSIDREALIDLVEKEYDELQKRINENIPPLEKGIILKGMERWSKLSKPKRIALTATAFFVGGLTIGGMSVTVAAGYGGYKAVRSGVGMFGAMGAGNVVERLQKKRNKKGREKTLDKYIGNIDETNFVEKERELMRALEKEQNKKKRQRLYKAGAMVTAGAGLNIAGGSFDNSLDSSGTGEVNPNLENTNNPPPAGTEPQLTNMDAVSGDYEHNPDGSAGDRILNEPNQMQVDELYDGGPGEINDTPDPESGLPDTVLDNTDNTNKPPEILETKVELSSKGFIQDIVNLKIKILADYPRGVPKDIQDNFMSKSSMELAKQYGFYDPEKNLSGMGLKGEHLGLDSHGHIVYEHGGTSEVMFDEEVGKVKTFEETGGKMFTPKVVVETPDNVGDNVTAREIDQDVVNPTSPESVDYVDAPETTPVVSDNTDITPPETIPNPKTHIELGNGNSLDVQPVDGNGKMGVLFNNGDVRIKIAHGETFGKEDIFVLEDRFQDGAINRQYREAFVKAFEKNIESDLLSPAGKPILAASFEGGKIHISYGQPENPNDIKVLLNGKEIAKGLITEKGVDMKIGQGLKGGWFMADTVYERAFKVAKTLVKTIKVK